MKKHVYFFAAGILLLVLCILMSGYPICPFLTAHFKKNSPAFGNRETRTLATEEAAPSLARALELLRIRDDKQALSGFEAILLKDPDNLSAMWGKAEIKRRRRDYIEAEDILKKVISRDPGHAASLISLAYIRCNSGKLNEALELSNRALSSDEATQQDKAMAYMMLGTINNRLSSQGWLLSKIRYGTQIKRYFLRARELSPELPEVHLGLGSFYLLAPGIAGGNLDKAIEELEYAVRIAPGFATANARLAQAYRKKGDMDKYRFYKDRASGLDPQNEVLVELK